LWLSRGAIVAKGLIIVAQGSAFVAKATAFVSIGGPVVDIGGAFVALANGRGGEEEALAECGLGKWLAQVIYL
jgi:hypothetical protein